MDSKAWFNINSAPYIPQICRQILWPETSNASWSLDRYGMQHLWAWNERLYVSREGICSLRRLVQLAYIAKQHRTSIKFLAFICKDFGSAALKPEPARTHTVARLTSLTGVSQSSISGSMMHQWQNQAALEALTCSAVNNANWAVFRAWKLAQIAKLTNSH